MRVFVPVILISCLFNIQTTEGQLNGKLRETEENKKIVNLYFKEFMVVDFKENQACLEQSGGTQYHDLRYDECQPCESRENSHERYTLCPEYQLKKANTELEKADKELEKSNTELEKKLEQANKEMEKKLELMELETRKQVASSNTLAIVAIVLAIVAIVLLTVIIVFVVRYNSRTLRPQDGKQNNIEESVKFLKRNGEPSTGETSFSIANEEISTEPHQIPKIFSISGWKNDKIRKLFQTIQHSSSKIEEMVINMKPQVKHVSDVVATFPHFTRKLQLLLLYGKNVDRRRRFCRKLTEEIINFNTSKLQTQELKVEVRFDINMTSPISLEVVLRRGEPPHFTKFAIYEWNDDETRKLLQTIQHSSTKIAEMVITMMEIRMMPQQLDHVSDVVATFPHFTRKLVLDLNAKDDPQRFCRKLTEEINNFDTSKLQTEELKVEVQFGSTTLFLGAVLRRGKPPHFTKFEIYYWTDENRKLFQTIQNSSSTIEEMVFYMKPQLEYVTDVVATFPLLTRKLQLELRGGDANDRRQFGRKLMEEISNFDNSKLQTEVLKMEVQYDRFTTTTTTDEFEFSPTFLLEVVLRRGKPSHLIKKNFN